VVLNAANEVAIDAFLEGRVSFLQLSELVADTLSRSKISPAADLPTIIAADADARRLARELLKGSCSAT